jgi:hypothetical protein
MKLGLSQLDVGVHSRTAISEMENGRVNFTIETLVQLLEKLDGHVSDAFESRVPLKFQGPDCDLYELLAELIATQNPAVIELVRLQLELAHERFVRKPQHQQS